MIGLLALAGTLMGAGIYSNTMSEWYTSWGKHGTALFRTWMIVPLILSFCIAIVGGIVLFLPEQVKPDAGFRSPPLTLYEAAG